MPATLCVHSGFNQRAAAVVNAVVAAGLVKGAVEVVLAGHSQGGAVAGVAVLNLAQRFPKQRFRCITFGAPLYAAFVAAAGRGDPTGSNPSQQQLSSVTSHVTLHVVATGDIVPLLLHPTLWR